MDEIWQRTWEFEHPSGVKVRAINTAIGIELFQEDVLKIIFPELDKESREKINIEVNKHCVINQGENLEVKTINALAVHSLSSISKAKAREVRSFMQWVRVHIMPNFRERWEKNLGLHYAKYAFCNIDYSKKNSLINYLLTQGESWHDECIDWYIQLVNKKIPLSTECPMPSDTWGVVLRQEYFTIASKITEQIYSYQDLYEQQVLLATNLLKAQELDLLVLNLLRKLKYEESTNIIKQGLFLQALHSVDKNRFRNLESLTLFYLRLIECFSNEILAE
ncbi:hypothetical protein [Dendronalium sp. ChiSLP03b]|uniref:hypothetical protein n=1 Tax=Dendronalium sp. ChiSLP03b TaxID=3075381 RepID=UPI002AD259B2|nr:hypothetical protein [Dendronalium sp. ChiSLP03b]MDZ8203537.1 hypothetical protein [Dendronalium sp. ChiSLP03b]